MRMKKKGLVKQFIYKTMEEEKSFYQIGKMR